MDEELKAMLENAKAQGANDSDLGKIIDMYESDAVKKKVSSSISKNPELVSEPKTGSSGGVNSKMQTLNKTNLGDLSKINSPESDAPKINPQLKKALQANKINLERKSELEKELKTVTVTPENQDEVSVKTDELSRLNKQQNEQLIKSKERELARQNYNKISSLTNKLATGSSQLGADIAAVPEFVYDIAAIPQNFVADNFDLPFLHADSDKFKKTIGVNNAIKDFYRNEVVKLKEEALKTDLKYQDGVYDSFVNGNYSAGFDQLTNSFTESLPATASIMVGGATIKAPQLIAASTMLFGAGKNEQLKEENPEINSNIRVANALATGLAEGVFETVGSGSIGAAARGLIAREGAKKATTILKDGLVNFYKSALAKNPITASMAGEGIEEWATQVTQNSIDVATGVKPEDYNVFTGGADAFIGGAFGGAVFGAGLKGLKQVANYQDKNQIKSNTTKVFQLQNALQNPNISEESRAEINKNIDVLINNNQKLVSKNVDHVESLSPKVKEELLITVGVTESIKEKASQIKSDPNTSESEKQILLDNLSQEYKIANERKTKILEGSITEVDVLPLKQQDKLKAEALKELTVALNPDGKKNITITNEQVTERANLIYSNKIKNEAKQETPVAKNKQETQSQTESEKTEQEILDPPVVEQTTADTKAQPLKVAPSVSDRKIEGNSPLSGIGSQENGSNSEVNLPLNENFTLKQNEGASQKNTATNGDVRPGTTDVAKSRVPEPKSDISKSVSGAVNTSSSEGEVEISDLDHAIEQINKGVLQWHGSGDIGSPRINLGITWADIRKGEADINRGKENTAPAKKLIEALKKGKENGGYEYVQGAGAKMQKQFVSLSDIERSSNDYELTDLEQKEVDAIEAELANEYEIYFESLDLQTQNDIYENKEGIDGMDQESTASGKSENDVSDKKNPTKPTTKDRISERIKLSDAKIDAKSDEVKAKLKAFSDMFPKADINPDDYYTNGFSAEAIVDMVAKAAKSIARGGIITTENIKEAIKAFNVHFDDEVDFEAVSQMVNPKVEKSENTTKSKELEEFRDAWNRDATSTEVNQYDSGRTITREHSELRNNQNYDVKEDLARVNVGLQAIEKAKVLFGAEYIEKTLSFIEQANLDADKKAVAYVLLENEMELRVREFPDNLGIQKLQDLVRAKSQEFLSKSARAIGAGRFRIEKFRELSKNGFTESEFTNSLLTTKQIETKAEIEKLSQVTSDDVNAESDLQNSDEEFTIVEPTIKRNKQAVKKDISNVLEQMRKDLLKVAKGGVALSSIPYAAQLQAVTPHILKLSKLLAELGGMNTKTIIDEIHKNIKTLFPEIEKKDVSDILKDSVVRKKASKTAEQKKQDSVREIVKQALIDKGFSREITISKNEKDADGSFLKDENGNVKRTKEKRTVLDWKKLSGEEGSVEKIRKNVEEALAGSKYSAKAIKEMGNALEKEYVRLSADIIEKGLNELQNRNTPRKPVNTKSAAKKLAELNNYGLFSKNKDSYEKIINTVLGFNELDQKAFDEMKQIAQGYSVLMDSGLTDIGVKDAVNALSRRQSRLIHTVAFSQGDWKFKLSVALGEMANLSTRFKLVNLGNLAENISSGMMARAANRMMDAMINAKKETKTSNNELRNQSKKNAKAKLRGITFEAAEAYGDTSSLLLNNSVVEDYFNNATTNKLYHAIVSTYMAKPVLEGADSYNKILITEAKMVRAALVVLQKKGMTNAQALDYVSKALTGESMADATTKAKELIDEVNAKTGQKLLNDSESSVKSLASDIVKDALVTGGQISVKELMAIYNAAYKSAGKDIGHVSNNWVTTQISKIGSDNEKRLSDAIKEKNWGVATGETINQLFWRNFISTFIGGGTNWFVKGLQKSANPLSYLSSREDRMKLKMAGELDITTDEGIKRMEEVLYRGMNYRSTQATRIMGVLSTLLIGSAFISSGGDDSLDEWMDENPWAKKYIDKLLPDVMILLLALKNEDYKRYIAKMINVKADFFDDQKNIVKILEKYASGYAEEDSNKLNEASGELGVMIGKRFEFPGPVRAVKDIKRIYNGTVKGEYDETDYYVSGFGNGLFQGGVIESWGLRPESPEE